MEDLVQDVLIKAYKYLHQYRPNSNFKAWIFKIAYNQSMIALKKVPHTQPFHPNLHEGHYDFKWGDESTLVMDVLKRLSSDDRAMLFLRVYEDLSYKDISKILNKREATLRNRYERAKQSFIYQYEEALNDEQRAI